MTPKSKRATTKGLSLHVGINAVNPQHYGGFDAALVACERDAADLSAMGEGAGIKPTVLTAAKATRANVLAGLSKAAAELATGDLFLLSFSGYGGQVPDQSGDERQHMNITWCLYDGQLIEDEIFAACARFQPGVRIIVVADCSYFGTVTRAAAPLFLGHDPSSRRSIRMIPAAVALSTYTQNRRFYATLLKDRARARPTRVSAIIVMQAAQQNQSATEDEQNGEFTKQLLAVWDEGAFKGDYTRFVKAIAGRMPATQTPNLITRGNTAGLLKEKPFTV